MIHAFWVPEFLFKRDVMPNPKENHSDNVFQITKIEQEGAFVGRCAENVRHLPLDDELRGPRGDRRRSSPHTSTLAPRCETNAEAFESIGESPIATTTHPFNTSRQLSAADHSVSEQVRQ